MPEPGEQIELTRLKYGHVETVIALCLVGLITVGGFVCMVEKIEGGQTVVVAVLGLVTGWIGAKKSMSRSGR
jgi:hypothetical protein